MRKEIRDFRENKDFGTDLALSFAIFALLAAGLVMVYSSSFILANERFHNGFYFFKRHSIYAVIGLTAFILGWKIPLERIKQRTSLFIGIAIAALILTYIPGVSHKAGGAARWIGFFGFTFQPAEFAKLAVLLFLARQVERKIHEQDNWRSGFLTYFLSILPIYGLLLLQPDFGSTALLIATSFLVLFGSGARLKYLALTLAIAVPSGLLLILTSPYRRARIAGFLDPWSDPAHKGFQVIQSFLAFFEGKIWGVGLGNSKEKLFYLPEAHNDFIFAVIGEELGLVGVSFILAMFLIIIIKGLKVAETAESAYERALAIGISSLVGLQAFCNMGVVLGLLPTKGFPLPLVSYGGSSLIITLFMLGLIIQLSSDYRGDYRGDYKR